MLTIKYQTTFKKDYKRVVSRGYNINLLTNVIEILAEGKTLFLNPLKTLTLISKI
ncbi:MAG: type II toxin-antitoxin system YafQ family toxin [Oscillospiraceae bacterium]|nr:type II toxin-antitoxin system YafQ family toxin [Oscillospiraceae bacterium]